MADNASGWVQVRLIGVKAAVKALVKDLSVTHEVKADSGTFVQSDGQGMRTFTLRRRPDAPSEGVLDGDRLLTTGEVAEMWGMHPNSVTKWATDRAIPSTKTPGGHRRYKESDVLARLRGETPRGES